MKRATDSAPAGGEAATPPRFVVGIDLGTTNCAVAYVDTDETAAPVRVFPVLQLVAPGETEARETLPSFQYEAAAGELTAAAVELPWDERGKNGVAVPAADSTPAFVGLLAREQGARAPGRLVASAKSWLSHSGVDRQAPLLPWHGAADVTLHSPVEVSAHILAHIRAAWDHTFAEHPMADQDVVITVPASFDEVARELTVAAARLAGLPRIVLLEEPQAAFYAWIDRQGEEWPQRVTPGQTILVCDIGGGTTDLTLIEVRAGEDGEIRFHRVAVGDHLILGGDNLDLALAHEVERRLELAEPLTPAIWSILIRRCQRVKELLLSAGAPAETTLSLPRSGSRLIAGARQVTLGREEVRELLLDGFLPRVAATERPSGRSSGFQEFGLPYAADPAITRYLAEFLARHGAGQGAGGDSAGGSPAGPVRPDAVLLNGGVFASEALSQRLLETLTGWYLVDGEAPWAPDVLRGARLDLAVAEGAAYFGRVRRGEGIRIAGGLPRSYYIGIETAGREGRQALCLIPAGLEEGQTVHLEHRFDLRIRQPVEMAVFASSLRTTDAAGDLVEIEPESLTALPPIRTVLKSGRKAEAEEVPVRLEARLTEVGTLETWCREESGDRSWRLQFDARAATRTDVAGHLGDGERSGIVDEETVARCRERIGALFAPAPAAQRADPSRLVKWLEEDAGMRRQAWPTSLLRALWESLMAVEGGRGLGVAYEARWLHLTGYALRPGYGLALDDWRVATTWRHFLGRRPEHPRNEMCRAEWWVFWRRLAGGLSSGQQLALASPVLAALRAHEATSRSSRRGTGKRKRRARKSGGGKAGGAIDFKGGSHETAEIWRLLGALEWLDVATQEAMGETILARLGEAGPGLWNGAGLWTLGRLGARVPQYGPLNTTLPIELVEGWLPAVIELDPGDRRAAFAAVQLTRRTGDRYRDVGAEDRRSVADWLRSGAAPASYLRLVEEGGDLDRDSQAAAYGESLPAGIRLL